MAGKSSERLKDVPSLKSSTTFKCIARALAQRFHRAWTGKVYSCYCEWWRVFKMPYVGKGRVSGIMYGFPPCF